MNERLHNLLDGNLSEKESEELFTLPEEKLEFQEHQQLRMALRQNGEGNALASGEKLAMKTALAAAIGLEGTAPVSAAPAAQTAVQAPTGTSWYLKGLRLFCLGLLLEQDCLRCLIPTRNR